MPDFSDNLKPLYDGPAQLASERQRSNILAEELTKHLLSRNGFLDRQTRICNVLENDPLFNKSQQMNLSRPDRYHLGLARSKSIRKYAIKYKWNMEDFRMAEYLNDEMLPYHMNASMFPTTVREQGSEQQRAFWMPKIENWEALGAYGQTELGHGSNVRGLECQAIWQPKTKDFIIHSPTLTAAKWWNGSLGRTANHAIVVAQLMLPVDGKIVSHGPHPFIVQIRDLNTHKPLDGVIVGDIGPKYGYASMDNGYLLFNKFRAPYDSMLSRYAQVDPSSGKLKKTGHPAVVYGSLTNVRANIVMHARLILARAVTIAVRYTAIRRQFKDRDARPGDNSSEVAVLDYPTVQIRILPLLATTFALHYTGEVMYKLYSRTRGSIEKGDFSKLAELHSTSSGLKSLCTTLAADGIETCRRAMGGHGFGGGSGLVEINNDYLSKPTVEGDNWMITQQVASYLIKKMDDVVKNPTKPPVDETDSLFQNYIREKARRVPRHAFVNNMTDDSAIVEAFQWRAASLAYQAYHERIVKKRSWTSMMIQLHKLSRAYSESILVSNNFAELKNAQLATPTLTVLWDLFRLYAFYTMDSDARTFSTTNAVSSETLDKLQSSILDLMTLKIRPHAVKLVDSWAIPDFLLNSALGRYDGKVYETLFDMAHRKNPLNLTTFNVKWRDEEIVLGSGQGWKDPIAKL